MGAPGVTPGAGEPSAPPPAAAALVFLIVLESLGSLKSFEERHALRRDTLMDRALVLTPRRPVVPGVGLSEPSGGLAGLREFGRRTPGKTSSPFSGQLTGARRSARVTDPVLVNEYPTAVHSPDGTQDTPLKRDEPAAFGVV